MYPCFFIIWQATLHYNIGKIRSLFSDFILELFSRSINFWSTQFLFQTVQSTNPLTEEENNFLDHIEQKIHQQAAKNAEEARQRQVWTRASIFWLFSNWPTWNICFWFIFEFRLSMKKIWKLFMKDWNENESNERRNTPSSKQIYKRSWQEIWLPSVVHVFHFAKLYLHNLGPPICPSMSLICLAMHLSKHFNDKHKKHLGIRM